MATRTAWTPTATTGEEVSQTDFRSIPGGMVAHATKTSNQTGVTADTDVTSLSTTVTLVNGRRYRVDVIVHVQQTGSGGLFRINIDDGGRVQLFGADTDDDTNAVMTCTPWCIIDGDDTVHTIKATIDLITAGTYTVLGNAQFPGVLTICDVGPTF